MARRCRCASCRMRRYGRLLREGFSAGWRTRWAWIAGVLIGVLARHLPPVG